MQVLLFLIVAICITGSRTQEIAIGTEYLRAHANDSFPTESAINAQLVDLPPNGLSGDLFVSSSTSSDSTTTTAESKNDNTNISGNDGNKPSDHGHESHHEHGATISIDVHNILDIFKQELHASEERILAAIQHDHPSNPSPVVKSYRTADR